MRAALLPVRLVAATAAFAQPPAVPFARSTGLVLSGRIAHPRSYSASDLAALPAATVEVPASGKPDAPRTTYGGTLLWPMLEAAGWVDLPGRKTHLQHVILAKGNDGYAVALAIAELDPGLEGKQVIVATTQDGKPLAAPELVVPGDKRAGRRVHGLVTIDVQ